MLGSRPEGQVCPAAGVWEGTRRAVPTARQRPRWMANSTMRYEIRPIQKMHIAKERAYHRRGAGRDWEGATFARRHCPGSKYPR